MVLFSFDPSQPKLSGTLNAVLLLLYRLEDSLCFFFPVSQNDLITAIRLVIRYGKSLGCKSYDTEI